MHPVEPAPPARVLLGVPVPVRDGTVLRADLWWAAGPVRRLPAVLTFTPYGRDRCADDGRFFAGQGFLFVAVDCRGRGDSEGGFVLYGDGDDYADAVAWLAARPECDGRVVTQGGSYAGINQWQVAARRPSALKAIAPMVAPMPGLDSDYWGGIVPAYNLQWATLAQGRHPKWALLTDAALWRSTFARLYHEAQPSAHWVTALTAEPNPVLARMVRPFSQADWASDVPDEAALRHMELPVLTVTGVFDNAQRGAIHYFERHDAFAATPGPECRFLVVGPSAHAGHRVLSPDDDTQLQGVAMASSAWQDRLCADFYRWALGEGPRPKLLAGRVNVFVCGLERWYHADSIAALSAQELPWHLGPEGLDTVPAPTGVQSFASDPLDERHAGLESRGDLGSLLEALSGEAPLETGSLQPAHFYGQGLHWDSGALEQPLDLCGVPRLTLALSTDLPDADLLAVLVLLRPDGRQVALSASMLRLRHRDGLDRPTRLMQSGVTETIAFPRFRMVARRLEAGSRVRLVIRVPASIAFERQMNAARPVAEQCRDDAKAGTITVHLGASHGPQLRLPLLDPALRSSPPEPG